MGANSHICLIRICEQMFRQCSGLLELLSTFVTYLNLLLLNRFAQLCFLRNESSLALTSNASKHVAKTVTVICNDIGSYFQDMQI